jgi:hypothetical protein
MRLEKDGIPITCLEDWRRLAPPKSPDQWVEGRSAYEVANAWCGTTGPAVPECLHALFETSGRTRGLVVELAIPEHRIRFDDHGGEPRNADLALVGHAAGSKVAVTVEAKADEPFGATVGQTIAAALERVLQNPESRGVRRVEDLVRALLMPHTAGLAPVAELRYQLLTAVAGTTAYAIAEGADTAVLVVHEFLTNKTKDHLHDRNAEDYRAFLRRLGSDGQLDTEQGSIAGPFLVPGAPLFHDAPSLLVGKVTTNCRRLGA